MSALDLPVKFGNVSIGESTARLTANFERDRIPLDLADDSFCERRLIGRVVLGHADDAPGQTKLVDSDHVIAGAFDVKGFSVKTKAIGTGFTFVLEEIDVAELAKFANGRGRLIVDEVTEIPQESISEEEDHRPLLVDDAEWREVNLDSLFDAKKATRKHLRVAGIDTVGQLSDFTAGEGLLTDIEGIGKAKAEEIEERLMDFWEDNPQFREEASA
ncbi:MAG: hypothetical protein ACPGWS_01395 [Solirubrobacterales bacterium]